jgi:hypothetical protein
VRGCQESKEKSEGGAVYLGYQDHQVLSEVSVGQYLSDQNVRKENHGTG